MKKTVLATISSTLLIALALIFMSFSPQSELPRQIQDYVQTHFKNQQVVKFETKLASSKTKYKVYLENQTKVKFDKDFNPIEVEGVSEIPISVLPEKLLTYVNQNYPGMKIKEWKIESNKQEVELQTGLELEFDLSGNFLKIDP